MKKKRIMLIAILGIFILAIALFFLLPKEKEEKKTIKEDAIQFDGETVEFKKYRINQKFYLKIPELFVEMSDEEVNKRYTNDFKPGLIFTDDTFQVNLLVHATSDALSNETLQAFVENYKTKIAGANITKDIVTTVGDDKNVAHLNYTIQNDTTMEMHHVLFFAVQEKAVMVDFKYPQEEASNWDEICEYTLNSLAYAN